jgi:hypothetical protein
MVCFVRCLFSVAAKRLLIGTRCEISTKAFPNATDQTVALSVKDRELLNAASELGMFMQEIKDPRGVRWF